GYVTQNITVNSRATLQIRLEPSHQTLNEVVVTGNQVQTRKAVLGSVAVVTPGDANPIPPAEAEKLLQGQAASVTVASNGAPGASPTVLQTNAVAADKMVTEQPPAVSDVLKSVPGIATDTTGHVTQLGEVVVTGALGLKTQARQLGYATAVVDNKSLTQAA